MKTITTQRENVLLVELLHPECAHAHWTNRGACIFIVLIFVLVIGACVTGPLPKNYLQVSLGFSSGNVRLSALKVFVPCLIWLTRLNFPFLFFQMWSSISLSVWKCADFLILFQCVFLRSGINVHRPGLWSVPKHLGMCRVWNMPGLECAIAGCCNQCMKSIEGWENVDFNLLHKTYCMLG